MEGRTGRCHDKQQAQAHTEAEGEGEGDKDDDNQCADEYVDDDYDAAAAVEVGRRRLERPHARCSGWRCYGFADG